MEYHHRQEEDIAKTPVLQTPPDYIDDEEASPLRKFKYRTNCCYGLAMDLLENIAQELEFDFHLYIVADGLFGSKTVTRKNTKYRRDLKENNLNYILKQNSQNNIFYEEGEEDYDVKWNGIVGDLISGKAHLICIILHFKNIKRSEFICFKYCF